MHRIHLYQTDSRANVDQQIWKNSFSVSNLKLVLWTAMTLVNKCLIWNVFEKKIAAFNQALNFIFLVNSVTLCTNTILTDSDITKKHLISMTTHLMALYPGKPR